MEIHRSLRQKERELPSTVCVQLKFAILGNGDNVEQETVHFTFNLAGLGVTNLPTGPFISHNLYPYKVHEHEDPYAKFPCQIPLRMVVSRGKNRYHRDASTGCWDTIFSMLYRLQMHLTQLY